MREEKGDHFLARRAAGWIEAELFKALVLADQIGGRSAEQVQDPTEGGGVERRLKVFDHVVIDTSAGITGWTLAALERATNLVLISSMDVACIRGMRKEIDVLAELGASWQLGRHSVLRFTYDYGSRDTETARGFLRHIVNVSFIGRL